MLSSAQLPGHFVFPWGEKVRTNEFPEWKIPVFSAPIDQISDWVMTLMHNWEKAMNLEKGFALDPIWGDFNAEIRKVMSKKMKKVS